jgi:hypothetical protein
MAVARQKKTRAATSGDGNFRFSNKTKATSGHGASFRISTKRPPHGGQIDPACNIRHPEMTNRPSVANRTHAHHSKISQKSLEFDWNFSVCLWQHWTPSLFGTAGPNLDPAGSGRGTRGAPTGILTPENKMSRCIFPPRWDKTRSILQFPAACEYCGGEIYGG